VLAVGGDAQSCSVLRASMECVLPASAVWQIASARKTGARNRLIR
jgi:hypothetical protein